MGSRTGERSASPEPRCPIRIGDPCSLCMPGASGPEDCTLVQLVMSDPDLRAELTRLRRAYALDDSA